MLSRVLNQTERIALCFSALLSFFSFFSLIHKRDSVCVFVYGGMPFLILFSFFLYLFLKCTLEDSDEADEGGVPLSLILTIVSICQWVILSVCFYLQTNFNLSDFNFRVLSFSYRSRAYRYLHIIFFTNLNLN